MVLSEGRSFLWTLVILFLSVSAAWGDYSYQFHSKITTKLGDTSSSEEWTAEGTFSLESYEKSENTVALTGHLDVEKWKLNGDAPEDVQLLGAVVYGEWKDNVDCSISDLEVPRENVQVVRFDQLGLTPLSFFLYFLKLDSMYPVGETFRKKAKTPDGSGEREVEFLVKGVKELGGKPAYYVEFTAHGRENFEILQPFAHYRYFSSTGFPMNVEEKGELYLDLRTLFPIRLVVKRELTYLHPLFDVEGSEEVEVRVKVKEIYELKEKGQTG